jgi:hypothetical protein
VRQTTVHKKVKVEPMPPKDTIVITHEEHHFTKTKKTKHEGKEENESL